MLKSQVPDRLTSDMMKEACRDPAESRTLIETEGLRNLGFLSGAGKSTFVRQSTSLYTSRVQLTVKQSLRAGIPVNLNSSMLQVPYQDLGYPQVYYGEAQANQQKLQLAKRASRWQIPQQTLFYSTNRCTFNYVLLLGSEKTHQLPDYDTLIQQHVARCALRATRVRNSTLDALVTHQNLEETMREAAVNKAHLVILVLSEANKEMYRIFKNVADRKYGLRSLCMVSKLPQKVNDGYMQNISMKINLKFGGINHTALPPNQRLTNTMLLGADLVHTVSGTIAAVVGSVDPVGGKCLGSIRLQDPHYVDHEVCLYRHMTGTWS
jgi:eukaryotic translation initiation factor 2C